MPKLIPVVLFAGLVSGSFLALAQQPTPQIKSAPIKSTSPVSGQQMYVSYCAACHGADATGNGPAAPAMKTPPTNLTRLAMKNGGTFPTEHVQAVLKLGAKNPAHGSADMPIWGDLLRTMNGSASESSMVVNQRIFNLTEYLKKIQQ